MKLKLRSVYTFVDVPLTYSSRRSVVHASACDIEPFRRVWWLGVAPCFRLGRCAVCRTAGAVEVGGLNSSSLQTVTGALLFYIQAFLPALSTVIVGPTLFLNACELMARGINCWLSSRVSSPARIPSSRSPQDSSQSLCQKGLSQGLSPQ